MYNMFNLLVEQACASEGSVVDRARAWCSSLHAPFFRFNPELSEDCAIDEHDDAKLLKIMWEARSYMVNQSQNLSTLKDLLINLEPTSISSSGKSRAPQPPPRKSNVTTQNRKVKRVSSASVSPIDPKISDPHNAFLSPKFSQSLHADETDSCFESDRISSSSVENSRRSSLERPKSIDELPRRSLFEPDEDVPDIQKQLTLEPQGDRVSYQNLLTAPSPEGISSCADDFATPDYSMDKTASPSPEFDSEISSINGEQTVKQDTLDNYVLN